MEGNLLVGFLDRVRLQIYGSSTATPLSLDFTPDLIRDVEIVNKAGLENQVKTWLARHKLGPGPLILVLADAIYFAREVTADPEKQSAEIQAFADTVPFEEIQVKHYTLANKHLVIAVNKEFLEIFQRILGAVGLEVTSIIPELLLGSFAGSHWMDDAMGKYVSAHAAALVDQSLLDAKEMSSTAGSREAVKIAGINRLWILVGAFVVLIVVLAFLLIGR